jgi:hypothetical protein
MPPSLLAALTAALLALVWVASRGRRGSPLIRNGDTSAVAALNRAQIALVQAAADRGVTKPGSAGAPPAPADLAPVDPDLFDPLPSAPFARDSRFRRVYRAQLEAAFQAGGPAQIEAMRQARRWGDRATLPLLRRGLRATDPAVVREAAAAINRFRGASGSPAARSVLAGPVQRSAGLPRNVARTL